MKRAIKHKGRIEDGQLYLSNVDYYKLCLKDLDDKEVEVIVKERERDPTLRQYGYYHGVVLPTALKDETFGGWTKEELDGYFKSNFLLKVKLKVINEEPIEFKYSPSKSAISREEMTDFLSNVIIFLAQQGVIIPESHQYINHDNSTK